MRLGGAALAVLAGLAVVPSAARADEPPRAPGPAPPALAPAKPSDKSALTAAPASNPSTEASNAALSRIIDRPHTIAELEAGIIALPTAPISGAQSGRAAVDGIVRGDYTAQIGLHVLYRWNRNFAVGAGVLFAPVSSDSKDLYGGLRALQRSHSRSYFFIGGEARYIALHYRFLEAWVGVSVGGVVIADRFTTNSGDEVAPIIGTKQVTVRTEGFAFGGQFGLSYYLSENWIAGGNFRAYGWVLPQDQRCSSIGDCATLSGTVEALELGLTIGYRLPL